jgi:hypothetical protein
MREHRADAWVQGHLGAIGVAPRAWVSAPEGGYPRRFRHDALAVILDRRTPATDARGAETRALLACARPSGAREDDVDDIVFVSFPFDAPTPTALAAAGDAHARWLSPLVDTYPWPAKNILRVGPVNLDGRAPKAGGAYGVWLRLALGFDDDTLWYRDAARWGVILEALARTAMWREVVKDPRTALDEARAAVLQNDRKATGLSKKRGAETYLRLAPNVRSFDMICALDAAAVGRLGRAAFDDLVALATTLHGAFRGRAQLRDCAAVLHGDEWPKLAGIPTDWTSPWPSCAAVVQVWDGRCVADGENGHQLQVARILGTAELPPGATREARDDGLVILRFAEDPSDLVRAAEGFVRCGLWLRELRSFRL